MTKKIGITTSLVLFYHKTRLLFYGLLIYPLLKAEKWSTAHECMQRANKAAQAVLDAGKDVLPEERQAHIRQSIVALAEVARRVAQMMDTTQIVRQLSQEDRDLVLAMMQFAERTPLGYEPGRFVTMRVQFLLVYPFKLAKERLPTIQNEAASALIYDNPGVPEPLRKIMVPFLKGEASLEATDRALSGCITTLETLLPKLFEEHKPISEFLH